jgi:hypothetical protein
MNILVNIQEKDRRLAICHACVPYFHQTPLGMWCGKCRCNLNAKIRFSSRHCPLKKW